MKCSKNLEQKRGKWNVHFGTRIMPPADSMNGLSFPTGAEALLSKKPSEIDRKVMELFEKHRNPVLRYALSFGIPVHDAEEVVQEVFLSLFRHLQLRNPGKIFASGSSASHIISLASGAKRTEDQAIGLQPTGQWPRSGLMQHRALKSSCRLLKGVIACWP